MSLYNSIVAGFSRGLYLESDFTQQAAIDGHVKIRHTILAGCRSNWFGVGASDLVMTADDVKDWFFTTEFNNDTVTHNANLGPINPYNYGNPTFLLATGARELKMSSWYPIGTEVSFNITHYSAINLYPNPASSSVFIDGAKINSFTITSLPGQTLMSGNVVNNEIHVEYLPAGMYIITLVADDGEMYTNRLVKK